MLKRLRQHQRGLVAWLLPTLLLAWSSAAAGPCAHAFGQASGQLPDDTPLHEPAYPHSFPGHDEHHEHHEHEHSGQEGHDSHGHADDCARYCMHCGQQTPAKPAQSIAVCGDSLPGVAMVGHQSQAEPDASLVDVFVPESAYDPAGCARVDPPPDSVDSAETIPINLRYCVFLN